MEAKNEQHIVETTSEAEGKERKVGKKEKMSRSSSSKSSSRLISYAYRVTMNGNDNGSLEAECCPKSAWRIAKYALCFILCCALLMVFIFFIINYDKMYNTTNNCMETLVDKVRNESVLEARVGQHKQLNVVLNKEMNNLQAQLVVAEEKYANATKQIQSQNNMLNIATKQIQTQNNTINIATKQIQTQNNTINIATKQIQSQNNMINIATKQIQTQNNTINIATKQIQLQNNTINIATKQIQSQNNMINIITKQIQSQNNMINIATQQIQSQNNTIDIATKQIQSQNKTINILTLVRDGLRMEVKEQKKKAELAEERALTLQDKIDLYVKTINELKQTSNLTISTDFLTVPSGSAVKLPGAPAYCVILALTTYYYV